MHKAWSLYLHDVALPQPQGTCLTEHHVSCSTPNLIGVHHLKFTDIPNLHLPVHSRCGHVTEAQEIIFNKRTLTTKNKGEGSDFVCKTSFKF